MIFYTLLDASHGSSTTLTQIRRFASFAAIKRVREQQSTDADAKGLKDPRVELALNSGPGECRSRGVIAVLLSVVEPICPPSHKTVVPHP